MADKPLQVTIKDAELKKHLESISAKSKETRSELFKPLAVLYGNMVVRMFKSLGGLFGRAKWAPIDPNMYKTRPYKRGTGTTKAKLRYGTQGPPTKKRFTAADKPLQASAGFKDSFKVLAMTNRGLLFGSYLKNGKGKWIAKDIQHAGRGGRFVLPVYENAQTQTRIQKVLKSFINFITGK